MAYNPSLGATICVLGASVIPAIGIITGFAAARFGFR